MPTGSAATGFGQNFPVKQPGWASYGGEYQNVVFDGTTFDVQRTPSIYKTFNALAIATETTLWTPAAGKKFRLLGGLISVGGAAAPFNLVFKDNTAGATIFILPASTLNQAVAIALGGNGLFSAAANNVLTATGIVSAAISGTLWGTEE